jgi:hypothetical protein
MTIIEKINSLENGRLMGVINSVDEGEGRTSTWAGSTGITTDEVKSLALALDKAETVLEKIDNVSSVEDISSYILDDVRKALATIKALKESE